MTDSLEAFLDYDGDTRQWVVRAYDGRTDELAGEWALPLGWRYGSTPLAALNDMSPRSDRRQA